MIKRFLIKFWVWNVFIDLMIFIIAYAVSVFIMAEKLSNSTGIIIVVALFTLLLIHALFLLVYFIKYLITKQFLISLILLIHITSLYPLVRFLFLPFFLSLGPIGY